MNFILISISEAKMSLGGTLKINIIIETSDAAKKKLWKIIQRLIRTSIYLVLDYRWKGPSVWTYFNLNFMLLYNFHKVRTNNQFRIISVLGAKGYMGNFTVLQRALSQMTKFSKCFNCSDLRFTLKSYTMQIKYWKLKATTSPCFFL